MMGFSLSRNTLVLLGFATVYIVWGSTYLAIRFAVETMPPFLMAAARFLAAGVILFAIVRRSEKSPVTLAHWRTAGIVGGLMLISGVGVVCWAEQYIASGLAALIIATVPFWMVLLDWWGFRRVRPTPPVLVGLFIGLVGIVILVGPGSIDSGQIDPAATIGILVACLSWAAGSLYARSAPRPKSPFLFTSMQMILGGLGLFVASGALGEWGQFDFAEVSMTSWLSLGYLIVFGSILALSAYTYILQESTAAKVSTYAYVNPVVAMALGWALAGEQITVRTLIAATLILIAVMLITMAKARPKSDTNLSAAPNDHTSRPQHSLRGKMAILDAEA